jgi:Domain of unknown function (DUF4760)
LEFGDVVSPKIPDDRRLFSFYNTRTVCNRQGAPLSFGDLNSWTEAAKLAPLGTMLVALGAAIVAAIALRVQRDIARRRAAIDFFLKTEMDEELIELYEKFKRINVAALRSVPNNVDLEDYKDARSFLNICELIAVGVNHGAFSEKVSQAYWGDVLPASYKKMETLINDIRLTPGEGTSQTYLDLQRLCEKWSPNDFC